MAEEIDGLALETQADVCVHHGRHADVSVTQQLFDDDQFDALLQEECRGGVPQAVEPDCPQAGAAEQDVEVPGEGGGFDGIARRGG